MKPPDQTLTDHTSPTDISTPWDVFAEIAELSQKCTTRSSFYRQSFRTVTKRFNSPYAAINIRIGAETLDDYWHTGPTEPGFWKATAQEFLTESLIERCARAKIFNSKNAPLKIALLSSQLVDAKGGLIGAIVVVAHCESTQQGEILIAELRALTSLISCSAQFVGASSNNFDSATNIASMQALAKASGSSTKHELAFSITNNLRNKTGCDQVVLGMVIRKNIRILSLSGFDDVPKRSPGVQKIIAAMEECFDHGNMIVYQTEGQWSEDKITSGHRLHRQWHEATGGAAVVTMPLYTDDGCEFLLSMRRKADKPFGSEELEKIRDLVVPFAPAIILVNKAQRSVVNHAIETTYQTAHAFIKPERWLRKVMIVATVLFALWFMFGSMPYTVSVPCKIAPAKLRHVVAPYNAVLHATYVTAGDHVVKGQLLYELDTTDLQLARNELMAKTEVAKINITQAMSDQATVEVRLARANLNVLNAQLDINNRRIANSIVRAQSDGIVVSGDMRKRIGDILTKGEPIFELTTNNQWMIELVIPENASSDIHAGLGGTFLYHARPESAYDFNITRISPNATNANNSNVFIAEANVDSQQEWIRVGMEGVATIDVDSRKVWWVAFHRVIDYLRLTFWT